MNFLKKSILSSLLVVSSSHTSMAVESSNWYVKSHFGLSNLGDQSSSVSDFDTQVSIAAVDVDTGFVSGLGVGYQFSPQVAAEIGWEYRTNDSVTEFNTGQKFNDGNYASNIFYLNGVYYLSPERKWNPYLGLGLIWVQEIDIDFEQGGSERSFSDSGDIGLQAFVGLSRELSKKWSLHTELRYGSITGIELQEEGGKARLNNLDYRPFTAQVGLKYRF